MKLRGTANANALLASSITTIKGQGSLGTSECLPIAIFLCLRNINLIIFLVLELKRNYKNWTVYIYSTVINRCRRCIRITFDGNVKR